jgi:hypothetical protein
VENFGSWKCWSRKGLVDLPEDLLVPCEDIFGPRGIPQGPIGEIRGIDGARGLFLDLLLFRILSLHFFLLLFQRHLEFWPIEVFLPEVEEQEPILERRHLLPRAHEVRDVGRRLVQGDTDEDEAEPGEDHARPKEPAPEKPGQELLFHPPSPASLSSLRAIAIRWTSDGPS